LDKFCDVGVRDHFGYTYLSKDLTRNNGIYSIPRNGSVDLCFHNSDDRIRNGYIDIYYEINPIVSDPNDSDPKIIGYNIFLIWGIIGISIMKVRKKVIKNE